MTNQYLAANGIAVKNPLNIEIVLNLRVFQDWLIRGINNLNRTAISRPKR
jgi:hypothetical protein